MGSLQVRLFTTYLFIIAVTLGLAALSLLLQLGEYRDSISYGNLEDLGRLVNSQAGLVINRPVQDQQAPAPEPNQLLGSVWGYDFAGETRTVDVHVQHLRSKLNNAKVQIETLRGVGYKLVEVPA